MNEVLERTSGKKKARSQRLSALRGSEVPERKIPHVGEEYLLRCGNSQYLATRF